MYSLSLHSINLKLLPIKIHFALIAIGACAPYLYLGTYARQLGYSVDTIGCVMFIFPILTIFTKIGFGILADKLKKLKLIIFAGMIIAAVTSGSLSFLPKRSDRTSISIICDENKTMIELCNLSSEESSEFQSTRDCQIRCNDNEQFFRICLEWFSEKYSSMESTSDEESCDEISGKIEFSNKSINNCQYGRIQNIHSFNSEILSPHCHQREYTDCYVNCKENRNSILHELQLPEFHLFFIIYLIFQLFECLSDIIGDRICFLALGDKSHKFGRQRLFATCGWGIAAVGIGFYLDVISDSKIIDKNYKYVFPISGFIFLLNAFNIIFLQVEEDKSTVYNFHAVWKLFRKIDVQLFGFWAFVMGFTFTIHWTYLFWFLEEISSKDEMVYIKSLEGIGTFLNTVLAEAPTFYISGYLMKKWGATRCMSLVLLLTGIELFCYSIMTRPIASPFIQLFGGVNYGLGYTALMSQCMTIAEPGTETTVIAIFHCIFEGIGTCTGNLIGGFLYQWYGGSVCFKACSLFGISSAVLVEIIYYFFIKQKK